MADRPPTQSELLDRDLAVMVATAPVWLTWFAVRVFVAWRNDRREAAARG